MFGNVAALEGLHVTGKYRDKSMTHTCSRHAAWDPRRGGGAVSRGAAGPSKILWMFECGGGGITGVFYLRPVDMISCMLLSFNGVVLHQAMNLKLRTLNPAL